MKFNRKARLDTSQVSDRRGKSRGGSIAAGGGIGAILLAVVAWLTGSNPAGFLSGETEVQAQSGEIGNLEQECQVVADIDDNPDCRYVIFINSVQQYWTDEYARRGARYQPAVTTFFSDSVRTACGAASSQVGPFYCPADQGVYLDLGFFDTLRTQFGVEAGDFGEAYVLAHEYGHHIQNLTGQMQNVRPGSGPASDAVRIELQADCYAGLWAHHATRPSQSGDVLITELTDDNIRDGLRAAAAVGDDYIQERFQGSVTPESWTHGSSEQRQRWFMVGLQSGALESCDTFRAATL